MFSLSGKLGLDNGLEMISQEARDIARAIHGMITEMNTAFFTPFYHQTPALWAEHKMGVLKNINYLVREFSYIYSQVNLP